MFLHPTLRTELDRLRREELELALVAGLRRGDPGSPSRAGIHSLRLLTCKLAGVPTPMPFRVGSC